MYLYILYLHQKFYYIVRNQPDIPCFQYKLCLISWMTSHQEDSNYIKVELQQIFDLFGIRLLTVNPVTIQILG